MKNFKVKVNRITSEILHDLSFKYGWVIGTMSRKKVLSSDYLVFNIPSKSISYAETQTENEVSLEKAISLIASATKEKPFKKGDWVYVIKAEEGAYGANDKIGIIISSDVTISNGKKGGYNIKFPNGAIWGLGKNPNLRKATEKEIEEALIEEAKRIGFKDGMSSVDITRDYSINGNPISFKDLKYYSFLDCLTDGWGNVLYQNGKWAEVPGPIEIFGFDVEKSKDGIYQFGCRNHRYTEKELNQIITTLDNVPAGTSVVELVDELKYLIKK